MSNDHRTFEDDDWTADDLAHLGTLDAERAPGPELKRQTIDALRARALLRPGRYITGRIVAGMAAAASIIFALGAVAGYATATRLTAARASESVEPPRAVARADSTTTAVPKRQVVWF